jgi:hypothetical protein
MTDQPQSDPPLPPGLRLLKGLVILLTLTMIAGVITVVALLVTRLPKAFTAAPALPAEIALPEGAAAQAVTFGPGWIGVVVREATGERFLLYAPDGRLRQSVALAP